MKLTGIVQQLKAQRNRAQIEVERLDAALAALGSLKGSFRGVRAKRSHFSAEARARMAASQRVRRARELSSRPTGSKRPIPIRVKRKIISAAGLARIRAAQGARWAKWKKEQKAA